MKRLLLLGALAAAVLVPVASAAPAATHTLRGTVVAKDRAHHALVVALPGGKVQTFVAPAAFGRADIGRRVVVRYAGLAGRLPVALGVSLKGHARRAVVQGTIVRLVKRNAVINAGGTTLRVRLTATSAKRVLASVNADSPPKVGDTVKVEVEIDDDGSLGGSAAVIGTPAGPQAGSEGELEVRGKVTALSPLTVLTGNNVTVSCVVPAGTTPSVQLADMIELKCDLIGGAWTVRAAHGEDEHSDSGDDHSSKVEARGTITALGAAVGTSLATVSVTPAQGGNPVTCTIPNGISLAQFAVGDVVKLECVTIGTTLTLKEIEKTSANSGEHANGNDSSSNGNEGSGGSDDTSGGSDHEGDS